jgi:hypothetical protein
MSTALTPYRCCCCCCCRPAIPFCNLLQHSQPDVADTPISQEAAFRLHSRPNSLRKIFLDFDGHVTRNTQWNSGRAAELITPPYDKDGLPDSFNSVEVTDILAIWRAVSEDFAPWDVDVTTEDPGDAYLAANGMRAAIGGAWGDCESHLCSLHAMHAGSRVPLQPEWLREGTVAAAVVRPIAYRS